MLSFANMNKYIMARALITVKIQREQKGITHASPVAPVTQVPCEMFNQINTHCRVCACR